MEIRLYLVLAMAAGLQYANRFLLSAQGSLYWDPCPVNRCLG